MPCKHVLCLPCYLTWRTQIYTVACTQKARTQAHECMARSCHIASRKERAEGAVKHQSYRPPNSLLIKRVHGPHSQSASQSWIMCWFLEIMAHTIWGIDDRLSRGVIYLIEHWWWRLLIPPPRKTIAKKVPDFGLHEWRHQPKGMWPPGNFWTWLILNVFTAVSFLKWNCSLLYNAAAACP